MLPSMNRTILKEKKLLTCTDLRRELKNTCSTLSDSRRLIEQMLNSGEPISESQHVSPKHGSRPQLRTVGQFKLMTSTSGVC
ncbi:hypothetical protein J6590_038194 [Homalodisca vitripennis]|nr:hypothetical protein J6590_038194 [Homalodisca vitripennis]